MRKNILLFLIVILISSSASAQVFEWARSTSTGIFASGASTATDGRGNIYMLGTFYGRLQFGTTDLHGDARDIYLVKYSSQGKLLWARRFGSSGDDLGNALAVDKEGNCMISGSFAGVLYADADTLTSRGEQDMFVARFSPAGKLLWTRSAGGKFPDHGMSISMDDDGNSYVTGFFKDTMHFSPDISIASKRVSTFSIFLAKYDYEGTIEWAKEMGGANYYSPVEGLQVVADGDGNSFVTGYFQNEANFDGETVTNHGTFGLFLAKFNSSGKLKWVKSSSKDGSMIAGKGLALDAKGNIYVTGTFTSTAVFDTITEVSKNLGNAEMFLAKYNPKGNITWLRRSTSFGLKSPNAVAVDAEGNPFVSGMFHDTATFGATTCSSDGSECFFIVKYSAKGEPMWARQGGRHGKTSVKGLGLDKSGNVYLTGNFFDTAEFGKARLKAAENVQDAFLVKLSPHLVAHETKLADTAGADLEFISCEVTGGSALAKFSLPRPAFVTLKLYDPVGDVAESYIEGQRLAGLYEVWIDLKSVPAGEYFCRLQAGIDKATKKIMKK
jgi:hypothetical protein